MSDQLGINRSKKAMRAKDTIAWECAGCGHRHLWKWARGEANQCSILMHCDMCGATTRTTLVQIAARVWAALWPGC